MRRTGRDTDMSGSASDEAHEAEAREAEAHEAEAHEAEAHEAKAHEAEAHEAEAREAEAYEGGGVLTLAAVPIGRAEDASWRLAAELAQATLIAAEDTRRVRWLASSLNIELKARIVSYYDAVETRRTADLLAELKAGRDVLLVTDAGTPGISDPGYRLAAAAAAAGLRVTALPGPSAVTTALAVSGLPTDRFSFEGFPPRGKGDRARRFAELAGDRRTPRRGPSRRGLPRAHQDPRGDQARHAGRTGRVGGPGQRRGPPGTQEKEGRRSVRFRPRR